MLCDATMQLYLALKYNYKKPFEFDIYYLHALNNLVQFKSNCTFHRLVVIVTINRN